MALPRRRYAIYGRCIGEECVCLFVGQLLSTADEVAKLQEELEQMKPLLAEAVQESIVTMQRISEDTVCSSIYRVAQKN